MRAIRNDSLPRNITTLLHTFLAILQCFDFSAYLGHDAPKLNISYSNYHTDSCEWLIFFTINALKLAYGIIFDIDKQIADKIADSYI